MDLNFRLWLEKTNIWGFEEKDWTPQKPFRPGKAPQRGPQDLPIERLNVQRVVEQLARFDLGAKKSRSKFFNECQWGDHAGAVRAVITPKINVKIQKLHHDLQGNDVWIMKKYFFIDDYNYAGKEDTVALEIFDQVKNINDEGMEAGKQNIQLNDLVRAVSSKLNTLESTSLLPGHTVKQAAENEFNLFYYLRGGGATGYSGAGSNKNIMEVVLSLSKQSKTGLIKAMVTVVSNVASGSKGGGSWQLMPADFEEFYMPTQSPHEIVETIMTALRTY